MSTNKLVKVGVGIFIALVVWSFIAPSKQDEQLLSFNEEAEQEVEQVNEYQEVVSDSEIQEPVMETPITASVTEPDVAIETIDISQLEDEELELENLEQQLMRQINSGSSESEEAQLIVAETKQVELEPEVEEKQPIVEVKRASVDMSKIAKPKKPLLKDIVEQKVAKKMQIAPKPKVLKRKVIYYDEQSNAHEQQIKLTTQTAKTDVTKPEANIRASLRPSYLSRSRGLSSKTSSELLDGIYQLQNDIRELRREQRATKTELRDIQGAPSRSLDASPGTDTVETKAFSRSAKVLIDRLPLRTGPSLLDPKLRSLSSGDRLAVQYGRKGWYRVRTEDGILAWVEEAGLQLDL